MRKRIVLTIILLFLSIPILTALPKATLVTKSYCSGYKSSADDSPKLDSPDFGQVKVLSHSSYLRYEEYKEITSGKVYEGNMFHVVGEILNVGASNVEDVKIRPTFHAADGSVIDAGPVHTSIQPLDILRPDDKSPFELILLDEEASGRVADYELSIEFTPTILKPYSPEIINHGSNVLSYYTVHGEVLNENDTDIRSVMVLATFYDEEGNVVGADRSWIDTDTLLPGQRFPFKLSNQGRGEITDDIMGYGLCAEGGIGVKIPYTGFQILSSKSAVNDWGQYIVSGEVENVGGRDARFVRVFATFYGSDGKVVTYAWAHPKPSELAAGQTAAFEVMQISKELTPRITSYSVQVDCRATSGASSKITCSIVDPPFPSYVMPTVVLGDSMTVSGSISPPRTDVDVYVTYRKPDGTAVRRLTSTNATGGYADTFTPDEAGHWGIIAAWPGDEEYEGAYMSNIWKTFIVEMATQDVEPPTVSDFEASPLTGLAGTRFTVKARVNDASGVKLVSAHLSHGGVGFAEFELLDDGEHGDGAAGDGIYGGTWDSVDAPVGAYSVKIRAVDGLDNSEEHYDVATFTVTTYPSPKPTILPREVDGEIVSYSSYMRYREYMYYSPSNDYEGEWRNGTFLHIVGVAQNPGPECIREVRVIPTFYDDNGSVIDVDLTRDIYLWHCYSYDEEGYPSMWLTVAPGQKLPFELVLINEELSMEVEEYGLSIDFHATSEEPCTDVAILDHNSYISYYYYVVGEVENRGEGNAEHIVILAAFYDEEGRVVGATIGWTHSMVLGRQILVPGQRWPFEVDLYPREDVTGDVHSYELSVLCSASNREPYSQFQVLNQTSHLDYWFNVEGEVKNIGEVAATKVCSVATFYDADGRVLGCDADWVEVDVLPPGGAGSFQLSLIGEERSAKVATYVLQFDCEEYEITKQPSMISCMISESTFGFGETITVSGSITPRIDGLKVVLNYTEPDGAAITRTVTTVDGNYSDSYKPDKIGLWTLKASWDGDEDYEGAASESLTFTVVKAASTITCSVSDPRMDLGEAISVVGSISPAIGSSNATLILTRPDGSTLTEAVVTDESGSFTYTFEPQIHGEWSVAVSWPGDDFREGSTSQFTSFNVEKPVWTVVRETPSPLSTVSAVVAGIGMTIGVTSLMTLSGLAQSFNSGISKMSIPDWLKDFLTLYAEETFSSLTEGEIKERKIGMLKKRELASLTFSSLILLAVFIYMEVNGLPNILDPSFLLAVIPSILISVVIVFIFTQLVEVIIAGSLKILAEFKIWLYGLASLIVTGILFLVPFASPGRVEYQGDIDDKKAGLTATLMILASLMLSLPFYLFHFLGFVTICDAGLMMSIMTACYSSFPFKPLQGEAVFHYKRSLWLITFLGSFSLFLCVTLNVLPHIAYLLVGIVATGIFTIILSHLR